MSDMPTVLPFTDERCSDAALSGGKGASLARMTGFGLTVPPGFVITSAAFAQAVDPYELRVQTRAGDMEGARELVRAAEPPREEIAAFYEPLSEFPVAVRSSACAEDSEEASYAGQQETYLNVQGLDAVLDKVVACWLSFFSDHAVYYRAEKGSLEDVAMAVVVQRMVDARRSGIMFTVDPVHGRKDRVVVEAAFGLGERVVSGEVTPDHYTMDRYGTVKRVRVVDERVMSDEELAELARLGLRLAHLYDCPQDIEWACDDEGIYLLQSRPITTL
jgi:pyruvate, water dikinase